MQNDDKMIALEKLLSELAKGEEAGKKEGFVSFDEVSKLLEQNS